MSAGKVSFTFMVMFIVIDMKSYTNYKLKVNFTANTILLEYFHSFFKGYVFYKVYVLCLVYERQEIIVIILRSEKFFFI